MRRTALLVVPLVLLAAAGCGAGSETPAIKISSSLQPIAGGQIDNTHTAAVGIGVMANGGLEMCSGTLIAPNLVLTARHCVSQLSSAQVVCGQSHFGTPYPAGELYVTTDSQLSAQAHWHKGQEVRVPSQGNDACGYDMALIILGSSITSVQPYVPRIDKEVSLGEVYTAVGYGITSPSSQNMGQRRDRTGLRVSWYNGKSFPAVCNTKPACGYGVASTEWQGEIGVCSGDSGGPALDANNKVIGVVSRGSDPCDTPVYGSVYAWEAFIVQGALDAAKAGGYSPPSWAVTGSTGGAGGASGAGGVSGAGGASGASGAGGQANSGGTGGGPVTTPDPQGTHCSASQRCPTGYACVFDSDPSQAYCAADCDAKKACSPGLTCESVAKGVQVCKNAPKAAADTNTSSGCSLVDGRGPAKPVPWVIGLSLIGLALAGRRRRG